MRKTWLLALVLLLVALAAAGCGTPEKMGSLEGWIFASLEGGDPAPLMMSSEALSDGQGIEGASITVEGLRGVFRTDSNGYFLISNIKCGTYALDVAKDGYEPNRMQATVLPGEIRAAARAVAKKWTVLVYLDADNNLEKYGIADFNEMETVGSTADVNIIVQMDRIKKYDASNGNWTNTRRYMVLKDADTRTITSSLITNMAEQQMDDPAVFQSFIEWGVTNYPADNYLVVMWNHGAGVWPKFTLRGACFDDTSGSSACLTNDEVRIALTNVGVKMDVLAWDACLMQMMEVGYELSGLVDYMVGSEEVTPGYGFPYNTMMSALAANPLMTPRDCSIMLVDKFIAAYPTTAVCESALDLTAWATFVGNVKNFGAALYNTTTDLNTLQTISTSSQRYSYNENVDLYDYAGGIYNSSSITDANLKAAAQAVMTTLPQAVIANKATSSLNNGRNHGVAILLPTSQEEWAYYSLYGDLLWPKDTYWNEFILRMTSVLP